MIGIELSLDMELWNFGLMSPARLTIYKLNCVAPIGVKEIRDEIRVIMLHFL